MAEVLEEAGYLFMMLGKWRLSWSEGRYPINQGSDEFYRVETTDASMGTSIPEFAKSGLDTPAVMEGVRGQPAGQTFSTRLINILAALLRRSTSCHC